MPPAPRRERRTWAAALALSLAFHGGVCVLLVVTSRLGGMNVPARPQAVSLRPIDMHRWELNRGHLAPALTAAARRPRPVQPLPIGQVVDVAPGNGQVDPNARYLAETNNRVRKQTRAAVQTQNYGRAAPETPKSAKPTPAQEMVAAGGSKAPAFSEQHLERIFDRGMGRPRLSQLFHEPQPAPAAAQESEHEGDGMGDAEHAQHGIDAPGPTGAGSAPNDNLGDVEAGDGTFLNTREWKYAGFFNRLKQAVAAHWDPNGRLRAKDPQGRRFGGLDRVTVLQVTLRPNGSIVELVVMKSSGLDFLDQEAVSAFEKAAPFSNPPEGMVQEGLIRFNFGFSLSNDSFAPRMFRFGS